MLQDIFSPTKRRAHPARLRFGNPGFFMALSLACFFLTGSISRHIRWGKHELSIQTLVVLTLAFPFLGFLIHVFRWRQLSVGQKIVVVLLLVLSALVFVPVVNTLPLMGRE